MLRASDKDEEVDEPSEDALMEAELSGLQRSYRVMQNDYKAYKEETKRLINKQNMLLVGLDQENGEMDTIRARMETSQNRGNDEWNTLQLSQLSQQENDYQNLIIEEQDKVKELDTKILEMEKKISQQRRRMGGVHNSTMKHHTKQKKINVLENRLDKAMVHFNQQLAVNHQLREEIDHFRRQRSVFENLYKKLSKELGNCKGELAEVIENSTQAFEQRDEAQTKILALKERTQKDREQHYAELKDLQRTISHDDMVKEFMKVKSSDRVELKAEEAAKKQAACSNKGRETHQDIINTYDVAFGRIRKVMGKHDLTEIVNCFVKSEEENFALFNYVTELTSQAEVLHDQVAAIKHDISIFKTEDALVDEKRRNLLKEIELKYSNTQKVTIKSEERLKEVNKALDELKAGIQAMFQLTGCDPRPIRELLGGESITNKNMIMYLGLIEQRTTEFLTLLNFFKLQKSGLRGDVPKKTELGMPAPPVRQELQIVPPSTEDGDEEEVEEEENPRPLTEAELRDKVKRGLQRRNASNSVGKVVTVATKESKKQKSLK